MRCLLFLVLLAGLSACGVDETVIRSETSVESHWRLVELELIDGKAGPELLKTWKTLRIPTFILASRRRLAALKGEEFDMKANLEELGIKKRGAK